MVKDLYRRYRHLINYLFFGVVTTLVNWGCYAALTFAGINYETANVFSWFISVSTAFFTNRRWVFEGSGRIRDEMLKFFAARAATGAFEIFVFPLAVDLGLDASLFGVKYFPAKILVTAAVTVLNYILSRLFVFTAGTGSEDDPARVRK